VGVGLLGDCSAGWSSSEISATDVSKSSSMTALDCTLENSLCGESPNGVVFRLDETARIGVDCVVTRDLPGEECRFTTEECSRCEGVYELNEELMRERCGGILEDSCERGRLEEGVVEELIFFSDGEDETDEVCGSALDDSWIKDSDSRVVFPAGVIGGSESADDRDCNGEGGIVFYPGEDPTWTSETCVVHGHIGLKDVGGTVLAVGDAYGEELACGMEQCGGSIDGLSGGSLDVESVDPPWASAVGEITFVSQVLTFGVTRCTE